MNVPKLRFKEFTDEWKTHKLKDLCTTCGGGTPSKSITEYWTGNISWISSSDLESNSIFKINISKFITTKAISESATKIIPPNSILIVSRVGVGKVAINYNELCTSQDFTNLINIKSNPIFLTYLLKIKMEKQIQQTQGTSIKGITTNDIKNINCTLPNIKEQEKIAKFLTTVDKKITNLESIITNLENQKKGLLQQIFSQKLRFKDKNGNNYPNWEKKKLGDISDVRDGTHDSPKYINNGYPLITSKNIQNGKISFDNINYISKEDYDNINKRSKVSVGDIIMGMIGTIGNVALLSEENFAIKNVALFKEKTLLKNIFLIQYLQSDTFYKSINNLNEGGTQKFISLKNIRNIYIKLPCLEEQTKIADLLSAFDRKLENQKAQLEHWKQIKKGLLQQMFV